MELRQKIHQAQVKAGEQAVVDNLKELGLDNKDETEKIREIVDDMFARLRDELGRPLTWEEMRFIGNHLINQVLRHRQGHQGQ